MIIHQNEKRWQSILAFCSLLIILFLHTFGSEHPHFKSSVIFMSQMFALTGSKCFTVIQREEKMQEVEHVQHQYKQVKLLHATARPIF